MPKKAGIWGEPWDTCSRCGFWHPLSLLTTQNGAKICKGDGHGCFDNQMIEVRPLVIQQVLSDGEEFQDITDKVLEPAFGDTPEF